MAARPMLLRQPSLAKFGTVIDESAAFLIYNARHAVSSDAGEKRLASILLDCFL